MGTGHGTGTGPHALPRSPDQHHSAGNIILLSPFLIISIISARSSFLNDLVCPRMIKTGGNPRPYP
jgi:hypothetical protein